MVEFMFDLKQYVLYNSSDVNLCLICSKVICIVHLFCIHVFVIVLRDIEYSSSFPVSANTYKNSNFIVQIIHFCFHLDSKKQIINALCRCWHVYSSVKILFLNSRCYILEMYGKNIYHKYICCMHFLVFLHVHYTRTIMYHTHLFANEACLCSLFTMRNLSCEVIAFELSFWGHLWFIMRVGRCQN